MSITIGILALQGNFSQHAELLSYIESNKSVLFNPYKTQYPQEYQYLTEKNIQSRLISKKQDIAGIDGLILPGGESSTIARLIQEQNIQNDLYSLIQSHMPTLGTCAGCILLSKTVFTRNRKHTEQHSNNEDLDSKHDSNKYFQSPLAVCDISIERNSYGRQAFSFFATSICVNNTLISLGIRNIEGLFIRAPRIIATGAGDNSKTLFMHNNDPVIVQHDSKLLCTFHPEAVKSPVLHTLFLLQCIQKKLS